MKKEIEDNLIWIKELLLKFGWIAAIFYIGYLGLKHIWAWVAMPVMFMVFLGLLASVFNWHFIDRIDLRALIVSWVFIFSCLKYLGGFLFEKN